MGVYDERTESCPYCGAECECDWVDVGVGLVQCGPYHCDCGASEIGPEFREWTVKDEKGHTVFDNHRHVMKQGHPFSEKELETNWYDPNKRTISPYANTIGGVLVDHKTAKMAYDMGLLDEKVLPQAPESTESAQRSEGRKGSGGSHE